MLEKVSFRRLVNPRNYAEQVEKLADQGREEK